MRKTSFFESIPGVKEIRKAREEWRDYQFEFQRAFERGTGRYPDSSSIDAAGIEGVVDNKYKQRKRQTL